MRKKILLLCLLLCLMTIFSAIGVNGRLITVSANTEENYIAAAEEYTKSDKLLLSNGNLSNKKIQDFAEEVKLAMDFTVCSEITQVIPTQILESTEENAIYHYNGKEYGFYVAKEGDFFDVLLIDFIYESLNEYNDLEYRIKIKPILQQSFARITDSDTGSYIWRKYNATETGETRYKYYVANPRFYTFIQNENALNHGDLGYAMDNDDGVIILQSRVNYGKILYKTESDLFITAAKITGKKILDGAFAYLNGVTGGVAGIIRKAVKMGLDVYNAGLEQTVTVGNENNIFTEQSKTGQLQNGCPYYSRNAGFLPNEEIVLSADDDSYAEFITVLSDANYKTHLTEICDFDIYRRKNMYESMVQVAGPEEDKAFSFYKDCVLFENQAPAFEFEQNGFEDQLIHLYMLPEGKQRISFLPKYSGVYTFPAIEKTTITISSSTGDLVQGDIASIRLDGGKTYYIDIENNSQNKIYGESFTCKLQELDDQVNINMKGHENYILKYNNLVQKMLKLQVNNLNCSIKILNKSMEVVKTTTKGNCYYNFGQNMYYILLTNETNSEINVVCALGQPELYEQNVEHQIELNDEEIYVRFEVGGADSYYLEFTLGADLRYKGCTADVVQESTDTELNKNWTFLNLGSSQTVCFGFSGTGTVSFKFEKDENNYQWEVNGVSYPTTYINDNAVFIDRNKIVVRRGTELEVRLKAGNVFFNKFEKMTIYNGYTFNGGILTINSDCQLTNSSASNLIGLESAYKKGSIAKLLVQVINDISSFSIDTHIDDSSYGFDYSKISNVAGETVNLTFQIVSPKKFNPKTIVISKTGGYYNMKSYVESVINFSEVVDFYISVIEIEIISEGGSTVIYSKTQDVYQQINNVGDIRCNRYFESGDGSYSNPYVITNERHLRNIATTEALCNDVNSNADSADDCYYNYRLDRDLYINDTSRNANYVVCDTFWGTFDMNYRTIQFTKTNIALDSNYGFFITNYGTIKNGHFSPYLQTSSNKGTKTCNIGVVCAVNKGLIEKIYISHTSGKDQDVYIKGWYFYFGGVAGSNYGRIRHCVNYSVIRGSCISFGGIAGWNGGADNYVYSCSNRGRIYGEAKGIMSICFGGIIGIAGEGSNINQPYNNADLLFDYNQNPSDRLTLYMGQIVGQMCKADKLVDYFCGGSAGIKEGVTVYKYYLTDSAVGMYFESSNSSGGSCIAAGTLITLADGRQVPVESLTGNERLLVWNLRTGSFDTAPILFIDYDELATYKIINLQFSDGTQVKIIDEHAFWDFDLNKYVFLREDSAQYIGHWFNKQVRDESGEMKWTRVQLTNVTISEEDTTAWSPVTYGHLFVCKRNAVYARCNGRFYKYF